MIIGWNGKIFTIFVATTFIGIVGLTLISSYQVSGIYLPDPVRFNIILVESYMVGEPGIISIEVYDADDNVVENYTGAVVITVINGELDIEGSNPYNFTNEDKGEHAFIVTPLTFGEYSTTLLFEDQAEGIRENVTLSVMAGPVKSLEVEIDRERMGWEGPNGSYYAGDDLYFTVYGADEMGNPSSTYNAPIIVTHDFDTYDKYLEPEPWQSSDGSVILNMVDGVASNYPGQPIKLFGADEVNLTFRSKVNLEGIEAGSKIVIVQPTYLDHLEALPGGPDGAPQTVDVKVGATQHFSVRGFDQFDNPVEIEKTTWRVDSDIKAKDTPDILIDGEFKAIEYFGSEDDGVVYNPDIAYSMRTGKLEVTAVCPRDGRELIRDISIRVLTDKDVWLDEDQIEPGQILIGDEMEFQANIYYELPVTNPGADDQSSALGDLFEVTVIVNLVDKDGIKLIELVNKQMRLEDLNTNQKGVGVFNVIVPWESFGDHIKQWEAGDVDTKNFIEVEIIDAPGGTDMSDFESTNDNNKVTVELYAVGLPGNGPDEGYLTGFDRDEDGLDDGWESHYFNGDAKPGMDPDGDGQTNLEEFNSETDPLVKDSIVSGEDEGGLMDSSIAMILFIAIGILIFLLVLVIILVKIFRKKPGTGDEEKVLPDAQGRIDPEIYGINRGMENDHRTQENRQNEQLMWGATHTANYPPGERRFPPPPPPDY